MPPAAPTCLSRAATWSMKINGSASDYSALSAWSKYSNQAFLSKSNPIPPQLGAISVRHQIQQCYLLLWCFNSAHLTAEKKSLFFITDIKVMMMIYHHHQHHHHHLRHLTRSLGQVVLAANQPDLLHRTRHLKELTFAQFCIKSISRANLSRGLIQTSVCNAVICNKKTTSEMKLASLL